jgi:hypothetical protein
MEEECTEIIENVEEKMEKAKGRVTINRKENFFLMCDV